MKGLKFLLLLLLVLVVSGCSTINYEIELNSSENYEINNKDFMEIEFDVAEEKEIHINMESSYLISATLVDEDANEIDSNTVLETNFDHYITFVETLDVGSYILKLEVRSTNIGDIELHIYEAKTTTYDVELEFELFDYHHPGETIEINFTVEETGFFDLESGFGYGYAGKLDLYGNTEDNPDLHVELYKFNYNLYLEPGIYKLELTHWRDYSNGSYSISMSEENSMFGSVFSNNKVTDSVSKDSKTYHKLSVEEAGIYEVISDTNFYLGFEFMVTSAEPYNSNLQQLDGVRYSIYKNAFRDNNKVYVELLPGNYIVSVYGIGNDEFGDYSMELKKTTIIENTIIINEGTAFEMVEYHVSFTPTSTITLEITEAGNYRVSYLGTFTPSIEMYDILDINVKSRYLDFKDNVYMGYFEVGIYVINIEPYFMYDNGLNKITVIPYEE